jgi:hypothetical protein
MAIRRPGVEITQEFVTESTTVTSPSLIPVVVGACYQVVDAFDDDGDAQAEALAGTYKDGNGYVSYDLPGLKDDADVDSDEIRVFMVLGSEATELNAPSDEEDIVSASSTATYTWDGSAATATFADSTATWDDDGVEVGDVVRVTFQAIEYDLTVSVVTATSLTVTAGVEDTSVSFTSYEIVRNPAQFVYQTSASEGAISIGDETDYITFTAQSSADGGNYSGSAGDTLSVIISETDALDSGSDGASGANVFIDSGAAQNFKTTVGSVGAVTQYLFYDSATEAGNAVLDVKYVCGDNTLIVDSGGITTGAGDSGKNYHVLEAVLSGHLDMTGGSVDSSGVVTGLSVDFSSYASSDTWYAELEGGSADDGVYLITNSTLADGGFTLTSGHAGSSGATISVYRSIDSGTGTGSSGSTSQFASPSLSSDDFTSSPSSYDILITASGGTETGYTAASLDADELVVTLTDALGSDEAMAWEIVDTSSDLLLTMDSDANTITVRLPRADGVSTITMPNLVTAITDDTDSNHNAEVFVEITAAAATSSGTVTYADAGTYTLDGGTDADAILLDADLIGSATPTGKIYTSYKALRVDVSDQASAPALQSFDSIADLTTGLAPISTDNPLGLGMYFALLNCPGKSVKGIGISATSTAQSMGTTTAWSSVLDFLAGQEVYALAPLTQDPSVLTLVSDHCTTYSAASEKHERIAFLNRAFPGYSSATVIASGTSGNTEATFDDATDTDNYAKFSTDVDFSANTDFTDAVSDGDTLVLVVSAASSNTHAPTLAAGASTEMYGLTVSDVDADDGFVIDLVAADVEAAELLDDGDDWNSLVDVTWTVYSIGTAISTSSAAADRVADFGGIYESRRSFLVWPSDCSASVDGSDLNLSGYYMGAAWAGRVASESPGKPFTNMTINGFTALKYSNGYFTESQLDDVAGGGTFVMVQDTESGPVSCRHQLATDVSSIQKRELSITKTVDYIAKFFRNALEGKIGRFNITQSLMDSLSLQVQGILKLFVDSGLLNSGQLTSIEVDSDNPDTLNIVVLLGVPYPCNYIALTLQI